MPQTVKRSTGAQAPSWFERMGLLAGTGGGTMAGNAPAGQPEPLDDAFFRILGEMGQAVMDPTAPILAGEDPSKMSWWRKLATVAGAALPLAGIGKIVYHGSPHTFTKFDMSKIGTGEGAQAYGHGLYFADSKGVAKTYADTLGETVKIKGQHVYRALDGTTAGDAPIGSGALSILKGTNWDRDAAWQKAMEGFIASGRDPWYGKALDELTALKQADIERLTGSTYHVELPDEAIAKMLDWDKPLTEQPEAVIEALGKSGMFDVASYRKWKDAKEKLERMASLPADHASRTPRQVAEWDALAKAKWEAASAVSQNSAIASRTKGWTELTGADIYHGLAEDKWPSGAPKFSGQGAAPQASGKLLAAGIPGIKYLDGSSRAAGQGSYNYVSFSDELPKILKQEK
jgi:hypothetical protein